MHEGPVYCSRCVSFFLSHELVEEWRTLILLPDDQSKDPSFMHSRLKPGLTLAPIQSVRTDLDTVDDGLILATFAEVGHKIRVASRDVVKCLGWLDVQHSVHRVARCCHVILSIIAYRLHIIHIEFLNKAFEHWHNSTMNIHLELFSPFCPL